MTDYDQQFNYLIKSLTDDITKFYFDYLMKWEEFQKEEIDASPLLNLTLSVYIGSLVRILNIIKINTNGESKLIENIELAKETLENAIRGLPFIKKFEYF